MESSFDAKTLMTMLQAGNEGETETRLVVAEHSSAAVRNFYRGKTDPVAANRKYLQMRGNGWTAEIYAVTEPTRKTLVQPVTEMIEELCDIVHGQPEEPAEEQERGQAVSADDAVGPLAEYFRQLRNMLGLHDWALRIVADEEIESEVPGFEAAGECEVTYGRRHAVIRIAPAWESWHPEDLREVCVHELIHCPFDALTQIKSNIAGHLSAEMQTFVTNTWQDHLELTVDTITNAIMHHLPLMEKPDASHS